MKKGKGLWILFLVTPALLLILAESGFANPITYSCPPGDSTCNGNLYGVDIIDLGGGHWQLDYGIRVTSGYTGTLSTDFISAIQVKNFAPSFSNSALTAAPGNLADWDFITNELNAHGCAGGNTSVLCTQADILYNGGKGYKLDSPGVPYELIWTFTFDAPSIYNTAHIKYLYVDGTGKKVGSLGSFDIPAGGDGPGGGDFPVPEPSSLLLIGTGLAGLGIAAWRRKNR